MFFIPICSWHDASACKNRILNQGKWYGHIEHLPTYVALKVCINLFFLEGIKTELIESFSCFQTKEEFSNRVPKSFRFDPNKIEKLKLTKIILHPDFKDTTDFPDLAILKVESGNYYNLNSILLGSY